jgi:hypothetical protein
LAFEELLIAEGSDWCWWYGPEHHSDQRLEFDQLFRSHLANVYRALGRQPPDELSRTILKLAQIRERREAPTGEIRAVIDGEITTYFEWLGAGLYRVDERSGSMHGKKPLLHEARYGSDGDRLFLRLDFSAGAELHGAELRLLIAPAERETTATASLKLGRGNCSVGESEFPVECAHGTVLEIAATLATAGIHRGERARFQFSLWKNSLPVDAVPQQGWIEIDLDPAGYG